MIFICEARNKSGFRDDPQALYGRDWECVTLVPKDSQFSSESEAIECIREFHKIDQADGWSTIHQYRVRREGEKEGFFFIN